MKIISEKDTQTIAKAGDSGKTEAQQLKASELKYRRLFEAAQDGILILNGDTGHIIDANPFVANLLGYTRTELLGKRLWEIGAFRDIDASKISYTELQQKNYIRYDYLPLETKDKHLIDVEFVSNVYQVDGSRIIQCNIRDVSEHKKLDLLLRQKREESEQQFRSFMENAPDGVYLSDIEGNFLYGNLKCEEITGYSREELGGKNLLELNLLPEKGIRRAAELLRENMEGKSTGPDDLVLIKKDGSLIPIEITTSVLRPNGQAVVLSFIRDITRRKQAENKLKESEAKYRGVIEAAVDQIFVIDSEMKVLSMNSFAADFFHKKPEDMVGKTLVEIFPEQIAASTSANIRKVFETGTNTIVEEILTFGDKNIWNSTSLSPMKDPRGKVIAVIGIVRDITAGKQNEENLVKSYQKTKKTLNDAINTMAKIVEMRDPYTSGHQQRVAELATAIAREIGCGDEQIGQIRMAATIHDIGKIYVPSDILSKPGKITDNEFNLIKGHPQGGYDIVKGMDFPCSIADSILQHHERLDGSGYPNGLKDEQICLEAKILSVSDVVEAMSSHRPYRPALGINKALDEIALNKGKLYYPGVVDACVKLFKEKEFTLVGK